MKNHFLISTILVFVMVSNVWGAPSFTVDLDYEFSGATPPAGTSTPWVTVTFDDEGTADSVKLTIKNEGLVDTEFMSDFYFNFNSPGALTASSTNLLNGWSYNTPAVTTIKDDDIFYKSNAYKADGIGGDFDLNFKLPTNSDPSQFTTGEELVIYLTGIGITADSFNSLSDQKNATNVGLLVAAHIQSINGTDSGWITGNINGGGGGGGGGTIPEPATLLLFGCGLLGLAGVSRKKRFQS